MSDTSMAKVSIIIPCYNQGLYITETLASVMEQSYKNKEVIIVNDGSDDPHTVSILNQINPEVAQVLHTSNQGLASARNNGIQKASGDYMLPLDADDLIASHYIERAVAVLENSPDTGIVYCRATLIGTIETEWLLPQYSLSEMLLDNVIFCSAMFRKSDWQAVGGYDPGMVYGWEDYDFWLSLIERGREVYQIPEILFSYRVTSDSMVRSKERWQKVAMRKRIFERHQQLFTDNIDVWINKLLDLREHYYTSKLYVDSGDGIKEESCLSRKVDQNSVQINFSLEHFETIVGLRFDPVDCPAVVELHEIQLQDAAGNSTVVSSFSDNALGREGKKLYFESDDPNCFLDIPAKVLKNAVSLTINLKFLALGPEALKQIVHFQKEQIAQLTPTSALKAASTSVRKQARKLLRRI